MKNINCITIRKATIKDFNQLYDIGQNTPELIVSATENFMDVDEFEWCIINSNGVFLIAIVDEEIIGFIYANAKDINKPFENKYACLVYLVVKYSFRKHGIAQKLYIECEKKLKKLKITNIYGWAYAKHDGEILKFMKNNEYNIGHTYIWVDKRII